MVPITVKEMTTQQKISKKFKIQTDNTHLKTPCQLKSSRKHIPRWSKCRGLLAEMPVNGEGAGVGKSLRAQCRCDTCEGERREEGELGRKNLSLQCSAKSQPGHKGRDWPSASVPAALSYWLGTAQEEWRSAADLTGVAIGGCQPTAVIAARSLSLFSPKHCIEA